jgi:hypothetical protein
MTLYDETFTFDFWGRYPTAAVDAIAQFQRIADSQNVGETMDAVVKFVDTMATPETAEAIATLMREGVLSFQDLIVLQQKIVERVSGRPTTSASSSAGG